MSLSTYYLEYGRHVARLHHHRRRRAYAPTSNTAAHDNHEKINSWFLFPSMAMGLHLAALWAAGTPLLEDRRTIDVIVTKPFPCRFKMAKSFEN